eukprot:CAMPEP_0118673996 /NCGR_PEP_ID=MMETSP0800-20121206/643_1 /TAXON_ID=210618 ORGANISM="Striatella unipunctata, Strain CCMP2910" /NCGR_SAMPLE_ID=MMETSP0800 /ASSEMBLY_ACC=CAM_ASM_000638 /LENGTH=62 /DNA_ID=CAMNT_0006569143 /DNA_START=484 /DNA_END=669 /DNA_ORIENTATION=-
MERLPDFMRITPANEIIESFCVTIHLFVEAEEEEESTAALVNKRNPRIERQHRKWALMVTDQ